MELADFSLRYAISRADVFPTVISYTLDHVTCWLLQAARGLEFLHSRQIVHRDVKALNMLLYDRGATLKLCDLEIGRDCQINMTAEQGTELWQAPEVKVVVRVEISTSQQRGKPLAEYGKPADCYSFGRVILELARTIKRSASTA
ncbi:hypothetical protein BOX15_Mlig006657g2 [Macrostomum lignano]|uniref:Protein kinase domain-containing protein n=1 Tax=Macrostomum lignano TaxID=282301 RepID=A0A267ESL5_9PLAT|nr:hypothetical protein BOX15_Mlig006657g2 [Macrostomum lignano]